MSPVPPGRSKNSRWSERSRPRNGCGDGNHGPAGTALPRADPQGSGTTLEAPSIHPGGLLDSARERLQPSRLFQPSLGERSVRIHHRSGQSEHDRPIASFREDTQAVQPLPSPGQGPTAGRRVPRPGPTHGHLAQRVARRIPAARLPGGAWHGPLLIADVLDARTSR